MPVCLLASTHKHTHMKQTKVRQRKNCQNLSDAIIQDIPDTPQDIPHPHSLLWLPNVCILLMQTSRSKQAVSVTDT